jgi:hypothetical protein
MSIGPPLELHHRASGLAKGKDLPPTGKKMPALPEASAREPHHPKKSQGNRQFRKLARPLQITKRMNLHRDPFR